MTKAYALVAVIAATSANLSFAADWPQWRGGPTRSGIVSAGPTLAESWPKDGPKLVWESEKIPADMKSGFCTTSVADGRVYVYYTSVTKEPAKWRRLTRNSFMWGLGGTMFGKVSDETYAKADAARVSDERKALKGRELENWAEAWAEANMTEAEKRRNLTTYVAYYIRSGRTIPRDALTKVNEIVGREFATEAEMVKWLTDQKIDPDTQKRVIDVSDKTNDSAKDIVICLDSATGKTVWKKEYAGKPNMFGSSATPAISNGRVYIAGGPGDLVCLDANNGKQVWRQQIAKSNTMVHSSPLIVDGKVIIKGDHLVAFDATSGEIAWRALKVRGGNTSPTLWVHGGKKYVICRGYCVSVDDGSTLWRTRSQDGDATVVVENDIMVHFTNKKTVGVAAYRISESGAEELWTVPGRTRASSPIIYNGHVYGFGDDESLCVELATGKVKWRHSEESNRFTSPILADGKIIHSTDLQLSLRKATDTKCDVLATAKAVKSFASPVLVDGLLYLRDKDKVVCYDLRK